MTHRTDILNALARYDEADANKRITSGEDLAHWEAELADAESEIAESLDDLGTVGCARLIAQS